MPQAQPSSSPAPRQSPRRTLLFVDSEAFQREVLTADAERAGYRTLVASDALEAQRIFAKHQPDAVVSELDLPGKTSGAELVAKLRASNLGAVIPIIAVSAGIKTIRGVTDAVIAHDVDDFLHKPIHGERLLWRISELIDGRPIGVVRPDSQVLVAAERPVVLPRETDFLQGKLEDHDVATLFFSFYATGRSGKLCLMEEAERRVTQVWFQRGFPVFAESNAAGRSFDEHLLAALDLDPGAVEEVRQEWLQVDRDLGTMLVACGVLGARQMFEQRRANVDAIVREVFGWRTGVYWMEYSQRPSEYDAPTTVSLHKTPIEYVIDGVKSSYDLPRLRDLLAQATGRFQVARAAHFILRELDEPYFYENLLAQVDPALPVYELLHRHPFDRDLTALGALFALWVVGGVVELDESPSEEQKEAERRRQKKAEQVRKAVASAAQEHPDARRARQERIRSRLKQRKKKPKKPGVASIMSALEKVSSEVHYENGLRAIRGGQHEDAVVALEQAVQLAPHNVHYYPPLAQALLATERAGGQHLHRALNLLKRAVQMDPDRGEPYHWMGLVLVRLGHREEAKLSLRRALELGWSGAAETRAVYESL